MTGFIANVFPSRNRVSSIEAFEGLELGDGKLSRPVLRGLGSREAARPLGEVDCAKVRELCGNPMFQLVSDWEKAGTSIV